MSFKKIIRRIAPGSVRSFIGGMLIEQRERQIGKLKLGDAFDQVYAKKMWQQGDALSGIGSEGEFADAYIDFVLEYAKKNELRSVLDGGCGDFSVGSRLAPHFETYMAADVSKIIVERNRGLYSTAKNVVFDVLDLTQNPLPSCDLILIRQVLQHLTNSQIGDILQNIERSSWKKVLITEEVFDIAGNDQDNVDLPSHTVRTRVSLGGGVFIDKPPFSVSANRITVIRKRDNVGSSSGLMVFELSR